MSFWSLSFTCEEAEVRRHNVRRHKVASWLLTVTHSQPVLEPRTEPRITGECLVAVHGHSHPTGVGRTEPGIPDEC